MDIRIRTTQKEFQYVPEINVYIADLTYTNFLKFYNENGDLKDITRLVFFCGKQECIREVEDKTPFTMTDNGEDVCLPDGTPELHILFTLK